MKKHLLIPLLSLLLGCPFTQAFSQGSVKDTTLTIPMIYGFYGYQMPGGDLADRFGGNSEFGPGFMVKNASNWIFGLEYNFLFGNNVKQTREIFKYLLNSDGNIINGDGVPAGIGTFERGHLFLGKFGKLFPIASPNPNSGFFFTLGCGYMYHKIRIEMQDENVPQLKGDYKRGYDRLSGGFALNETLGYMYFGNTKLFNLHVALDFTQAFTRPYRDFNFDTRSADKAHRLDLTFGLRISWMIPFAKRLPNEFYYY
jgi:hypothetical protein